jgi:8-oxo-dGTP diphosphatase
MDWTALTRAADQAGIESWVVGLVVWRGDRVLLLKRRPDDFMPNLWEIPGGHVEPGESLPDAMARELAEETGLRLLAIGAVLPYYDYIGEAGRTRQWNVVAEVEAEAPIVYPEHAAMAWVNRETYRRYPMTEEMRQLLDHLFAGPAGAP